MTVAKEDDVWQLVKDYGEEILAVEGMACLAQALRATLLIFGVNEGKELPRIWAVDFYRLGLFYQDTHAYLEHRGLVYNSHITWPRKKYPDFDVATLHKRGKDVTVTVLEQASAEWHGTAKKRILYEDELLRVAPAQRLAITQIVDEALKKAKQP